MCVTSISLGMTGDNVKGGPHRSGEALEVDENESGIVSLLFHYSFKGIIVSLFKDGELVERQEFAQVDKGDVYTFSTRQSGMIIQVATQDGEILLSESLDE